MEDNTIRTDDALISTDVDKLIRIISEKKKVSLGELHKLSGMKSRNALETWVKVLEDEGYVRMEYGLIGTYVRWIGMTYHPPSAEKTIAETKAMEVNDEPSFTVNNSEETKDDFSVGEPEVETESEDDVSPEELLERYVRRKRTVNVDEEEDEDEVKSSILKNISEDENTYPEEKDEEEKEDDKLTPATIAEAENIEPAVLEEEKEIEEPEERIEEVETIEEDIKEVEPEVEEEIEEVPKRRTVYDGEIKDLISAYMEEIKDEKQKLGQLKKKKEMFYRDELSALERKAEGELVSFMDYVLQHEHKLLEVKEGVLDLPEKVGDAIKLQDELNKLRIEGKKSLSETKKKVDEFVTNMKSSQKEHKERIVNLRTSTEESEKKVDALERIKESIDARSEKVLSSMESVRNRITDLNERMTSLEQYLSESNDIKTEVESEVGKLKADLDQKETEISQIESELAEVAKLSVWVREYLNDYESKIIGIDAYVKKSDQEIAALKAAAEAKYIQKYLSELESISDKYSDSLNHAIKTEKELNDGIEKSRYRIAELIKESQKLIRKVGSEAEGAPDYDAVKKRISSRTGKMRKTMEEKSNEKYTQAEVIKKKRKKKK